MKLVALSTLVTLALSGVLAADVQYSVIAFPSGNQGVSVSVAGQTVALKKSDVHPNIYSGTAPSGETYQYVLTDGQTNTPETAVRKLAQGTTSTGNEFFNRTQTVWSVPSLPQAYNPIYPTLFTSLNNSNEVATIIMSVNVTALDAINKGPTEKLDDAHITDLVYINSKEVFKFKDGGLSTSGQSTKDFAKQSWSIDFNKYSNSTTKSLLFGRTTLKLRAEETDATFAREKLVLDMLAAAGGATLSGSWTRVFINNEPYGLFLLMDDASTHLFDAVLHGGDFKSTNTGVTYKGNAVSDTVEGNLVYVGDDATQYSADIYKLEDTGEDKTISKKNNSQAGIIDFTKRLSQVNAQDATDAQHPGGIANLMDSPQHTLIHIAMNYLIGSWDGFWYQASNYYLNNDLATNKWTLITYDFDETYGNGIEDANMNTVSYKNYSRPNSKRPLVEVFLNNPYYDGVFQDILKTIVKRFFKPSVVDPILTAWSQMLAEDIAWTRSIAGRSPGTTTSFTVKDFQDGLLGNGTTISISQWVSKRASSLTTQLNFNDTDDLPALPPYTAGTHLDANGNVVKSDGTGVAGNGTGVAASGSSSAKTSASPATKASVGLSMIAIVAAVVIAL
ncbi:coth protein-domain-containing protein [Parasitella parasitica]|nr:coth protein-domain-containing protein [Parasitella parasitica]